MSCGTPVIAFRRGSVPEIIEHEVSGLIVEDVEQAIQAVARIGALNRSEIRRCFERRFTVERMAADYVSIYRSLLEAGRTSALPGANDDEPAVRVAG